MPLHPLLVRFLYSPNSATAAAMGERWYGAGQHIRTFFYMYFGSGLGGGLIVEGQPYEGFTGNAGEIGYFPPRSPARTMMAKRDHTSGSTSTCRASTRGCGARARRRTPPRTPRRGVARA